MLLTRSRSGTHLGHDLPSDDADGLEIAVVAMPEDSASDAVALDACKRIGENRADSAGRAAVEAAWLEPITR